MMIVRLALQSLFDRWVTALLTVLAIAAASCFCLASKGPHRRTTKFRRHHFRHRSDCRARRQP